MNNPNLNEQPEVLTPVACSDLLAALEQLHGEYETAREKWSKINNTCNEWYWEGRRDGLTDAILQVKQRVRIKAANIRICSTGEK